MYIFNKRIIVINKKRFLGFLFFLLIANLIFISFALSQREESNDNNQLKTIIVEQGDTLWDIVSQHSNNEVDIREIIHNIKQINSLETSFLYPGQELMVPTIK